LVAPSYKTVSVWLSVQCRWNTDDEGSDCIKADKHSRCEMHSSRQGRVSEYSRKYKFVEGWSEFKPHRGEYIPAKPTDLDIRKTSYTSETSATTPYGVRCDSTSNASTNHYPM